MLCLSSFPQIIPVAPWIEEIAHSSNVHNRYHVTCPPVTYSLIYSLIPHTHARTRTNPRTHARTHARKQTHPHTRWSFLLTLRIYWVWAKAQKEAKTNKESMTMPVAQSCAVAKSEKFWRATGQSNRWQTEWKTAPLAKVQLCEYENQTLGAPFVCLVARQKFSLLATAHDCETDFNVFWLRF